MKRSRMELSDARVRKAMAIAGRIKSKYPYGDFGRAYYKRGSKRSLSLFGKTYKDASTKQRGLRKALGYVGRGRYMGRGGYWGKYFGRMLGGEGGAAIGDKIGDIVGYGVSALVPGGAALVQASDALGSLHSAYKSYSAGRGAYVVENSIVSGAGNAFSVPTFTDKSSTTIVLSHKEYIRNIYAPQNILDFNVDTVTINPGLPQSFPWLSQVACNYEEYSLKQCMYTFRSTVDVSTATGQCGQVIMATQYNVTDDPFSDKLSMMTYDMSQSCKTTEHMVHGVECNPKLNSGAEGKYVRVTALQSDQDYKEYDQGILNIAVADIPVGFAGQSMGELWVTYTIELRKPKLLSNYGLALQKFVAFRDSRSDAIAQLCDYINTPPLCRYDPSVGQIVLASDIKYAAENSLPVTLSYQDPGSLVVAPAQPNAMFPGNINGLRITFAPYYSGQVKVTLKVAFQFIAASFLGGSFDSMGWNNVSSKASGNVALIRDVPDVDQSTSISVGPTYASSYASGWHSGNLNQHMESLRGNVIDSNHWWTYVSDFHLDIKPATGGIENFIIINVNPAYTTSTTGAWNPTNIGQTFSNLEIEEYNSGFRIKTNGSNDRLALVDENGNPTSFP